MPLPPPTSDLPTASGRNPWSNLVDDPPRPAASIDRLAFGAGNVTRDPAYSKANLPPYRPR